MHFCVLANIERGKMKPKSAHFSQQGIEQSVGQPRSAILLQASANNANVILEPYYGQLDYYAPILLFLAREYRRPIFQYLAQWDHSLGQIQKTRAITPHGEQLLFELGGYAYLWCDSSVPAKAHEKKLSYQFPSVDEAYLRTSWQPGDLLVGVSKGQLVIHAGGETILIEPGLAEPLPDLRVQSLEDDGFRAVIRCGTGTTNLLQIELDRRERVLKISRKIPGTWQWYCQGKPLRVGDELRWGKKVSAHLLKGEFTEFDPTGYESPLKTGLSKLPLLDPAPMKFPRVTMRPAADEEILVEVRMLQPKVGQPRLRSPRDLGK